MRESYAAPVQVETAKLTLSGSRRNENLPNDATKMKPVEGEMG